MNTSLDIRTLNSSSDMKLVQELEKFVWDMEPIPIHQTVTAAKNGGLMLGAFHQEQLVGFSYGFAGFQQGQSYLCSHMLGIHPDYQEIGIGAKLKEEQRKAAAGMGYELITWTFDPLESRNAYLNLTKLNGICSTYYEDCYGKMEDGLNKGLPSDRFQIEWWINSDHVSNHLQMQKNQQDEVESIFKWELTSDGLPKLCNIKQGFIQMVHSDQPIFVPVPVNFQEVKRQDHELAIDWRMKTREIFQTLFDVGYTAVSLKKNIHDPVHYYVLVKRKSLAL